MSTAARQFSRVEDVLPEIRRIVESTGRMAAIAHKDADADSLGSALAFAQSMRGIGKEVQVVVPPPRPMLLEHLPGFDGVELGEPPVDVDVVFAFDAAGVGRFGERQEWMSSVATVVNVDHHRSNEAFGSINLVEPDATATGEVVYRLLTALGAPVPADAATNLYAALFTDTGGFRHENTSESALRLGADLVALGADPGWVALKSYKSRSVAQVRLEGLAISALHTECDGRLIWSAVTTAMLRETGADPQESEGVIDHLQTVDSMVLAVLFKEMGPRRVKVSVRSRGSYDASAVCKPFGGGGHQHAAGAELDCPLGEATDAVLATARTVVGGSR